jgi:DUF4097 and DUF4098 domain-containing protein YvlB
MGPRERRRGGAGGAKPPGEVKMQKFTAAALLAIVMAPQAAPSAAAEQKETETVDRTIPLPSGGRLRLKSFSGDVQITGGPGTDVIIHAVRRATRERLENIKLEIKVDGNTIDIEANRRPPGWREHDDNVVETSFDIQVPSQIELEIRLFSGNVTVEDVVGRQSLNAFSGKLMVKNGGGPVEAETFSGDVELDLSAAPEVPSVRVKTFSGDVKARLPQTGGGRVEFSGFSGHFESDLPLTLRGRSSRNVSADLGSGTASLNFNTFSGSVRLLK